MELDITKYIIHIIQFFLKESIRIGKKLFIWQGKNRFKVNKLKKNNLQVLNIYAGSSGSAGLYIDSIYKSLDKYYSQDVIVSYHFPFKYGRKLFYRFTDLVKPNIFHKITYVRFIIRYFELLFTLLYSAAYILIYRPRIVNYSFKCQIIVFLIDYS